MNKKNEPLQITIGTYAYHRGGAFDELKSWVESDTRHQLTEGPYKTDKLSHTEYELIGIWIASTASSAIIGAAAKDIYESVKKYLTTRNKTEVEKWQQKVSVTLYGPDDMPLKQISTDGSEIKEVEPHY